MRVIAGSCRGRRLTDFKGQNVRPTPDRVREALFSSLQSRFGSFAGLRTLDLFAGSGALAIESLSRGADSACLVEKDRTAGRVIRENIQRCHFEEKAIVIIKDVFLALAEFESKFDLIFLDPPYNRGLAEKAVEKIEELSLLNHDGIVCAETSAHEEMPETHGTLIRINKRRYGSVMVHFYSNSCEG